jgi:glycosyltransferase involved in cell wall biosynthesis
VRILHAAPGFAPEKVGGVERYVAALAAAQQGAGHEVLVLAGSDEEGPRPALREEKVDGIPVFRLIGAAPHSERLRDRPEAGDQIRKLLGDRKPDLLHVHSWLRLIPDLAAVAAEAGVPAVATLHDLGLTCSRIHRLREGLLFCREPQGRGPCVPCVRRDPFEGDEEIGAEIDLREAFVAEELRLLRMIFVPSEAQRREISRFVPLPGERLRVLPVSLPSTDRLAPAPPAAPGEPFRIGFWGNLVPAKGIALLFDALAGEGPAPGWELHVWGEAPDPSFLELLREKGKRLPPSGRALFHGPFEPETLAGARLSVAVFPSLAHESHGFTLDEAFALGVPVVVSDRGAPPERIGGRGIAVPAGDPMALGRALHSLASDPGRLEALRAGSPSGPAVPFLRHLETLTKLLGVVLESPSGEPPAPVAPSLRLRTFDLRARRLGEELRALAGRHAKLEVAASREVASRDADLVRLYGAEKALREELGKRDGEIRRLSGESSALRAELELRDGEIRRLSGEESALRTELDRRDAELRRLYGEETALRREVENRDAELQRLYDAEARLRSELERRDAELAAAGSQRDRTEAELAALRAKLPVRALLALELRARKLLGRG